MSCQTTKTTSKHVINRKTRRGHLSTNTRNLDLAGCEHPKTAREQNRGRIAQAIARVETAEREIAKTERGADSTLESVVIEIEGATRETLVGEDAEPNSALEYAYKAAHHAKALDGLMGEIESKIEDPATLELIENALHEAVLMEGQYMRHVMAQHERAAMIGASFLNTSTHGGAGSELKRAAAQLYRDVKAEMPGPRTKSKRLTEVAERLRETTGCKLVSRQTIEKWLKQVNQPL